MPDPKINVLKNERYGIKGKVATMDNNGTIHEDAVIYIEKNLIHSIQTDETVPDGFDDAPVINTGGTIYP